VPEGQRRRLVIDANILIRAVLGRRVKETIIGHAEDVDFFAPEVAFDDAQEHLPAVLTKFDRAAEIDPALAFLNQLRDIVAAVPEDAYLDIKDQALARIQRDPDDWPVLAVAMLLDCPIWTEDNDFFGTGVPTWTTDRIDIYLAPPT
jgi:predicted nucleic acid-binding protein